MAQTKITGDMIADDAVTTALIADDAVTADQLANSINSAITANTAKVTNAITTHTGDVTGAAALTIADNAVNIAKLAVTDGSAGQVLSTDGSGAMSFITPATIQKLSSAPSVGSEGTLYYNTTTDKLNLSNGTAWLPLDTNAPPVPTGGTVTIPAQSGLSTFSYNLGLNFTDELPDAELAYTLESGTLPAGAVLPTSGNTALTGTATNTTATYNFVIRATDARAAFSTQAFTQVITAIFSATGGTITNTSGYRVHTFTSSGTFVPVSGSPTTSVEYLIIAGGGGGQQVYGGGGAGGYRTSTASASVQNYTVTVGAGAAASGPGQSSGSGSNGNNSVALSITSIGGGGGGGSANGNTGGSGGGGGAWANSYNGGAGTSGQGNAGGDVNNTNYGAGAGGGAGAVGGDGNTVSGGAGGAGLASSITGTSVYRSGGGGGGAYTNVSTNNALAVGGVGGGGRGGLRFGDGVSGTANTGGGGGGGNRYNTNVSGGAGGSGIVIIRYAV